MHKGENCIWYKLIKNSKEFVNQFVEEEDIVELTRYLYKDVNPFYLVIYKWAQGTNQVFNLPRHVNSTNPNSSVYYKKYPSLTNHVDKLLQDGLGTDQVYNELIKKDTKTVSENYL